jgi:hypothetical protein
VSDVVLWSFEDELIIGVPHIAIIKLRKGGWECRASQEWYAQSSNFFPPQQYTTHVLLCQLKLEKQHHYCQHLSLYLNGTIAWSSTSSCPFHHLLLSPSMQENGLDKKLYKIEG